MARWWCTFSLLALVSCDAGQVRPGAPDAQAPQADLGPLTDADLDARIADALGPTDVGTWDRWLSDLGVIDAERAGDAQPFPLEAGPADLAVDAAQPLDMFVEPGPCAAWSSAQARPGAADPELREASGLALGRDDPSVLWTHNDSGDTARLFAVDAATGADRGQVQLAGVTAHDVEDLAAAGCPDDALAGCLWVADVGDNDGVRNDAAVWIVPEPVAPGAALAVEARVRRRIPLRYPTGPVNVEALLVAPAGDRFWLLEKGGDPEATRIFEVRGPFNDESARDALEVGRFVAPGVPVPRGRLVTGADLNAAGDQVLVRVYTGTWAYTLGAGQGVADLGAVTPSVAVIGPLSEPQGEAVAFAADGRSFYTLSEAAPGMNPPPLNFYTCR